MNVIFLMRDLCLDLLCTNTLVIIHDFVIVNYQ
jgi:hypothetical protein